jgi:hypothetical protein
MKTPSRPSLNAAQTPRWLLIWWWLSVPWLFITVGHYAYDQTAARWLTGSRSVRFARWGDDVRSFAFPFVTLIILIWMVVAFLYIVRLLHRRDRVPAFLVVGLILPLLAFGVGKVPGPTWERAVLRTVGPGQMAGAFLSAAAKKGDTAAMDSLLARGVSVEALDYSFYGFKSQGSETALMTAADAGQLESVQFLLAHGANPNHGNDYGETPLMRAVASGDTTVIRLLLDVGADPTAVTHYDRVPRQNSVYSIAAEYVNNPAVLRLLGAPDSVTARAAAACRPYEPRTVWITGRLTRLTFPGAPGYGETPAVDEKETGFYLEPGQPLCTLADPENRAKTDVRLVQLVLDSAGYATLRPALGTVVTLKGKLFPAISGHHHAPVLLTVARPVQVER